MHLPLTLHVPRPPNAIAQSIAVVLEHTNVTKVLPLRLDKDTTARETERERGTKRERNEINMNLMECELAYQTAELAGKDGLTFDLPFISFSIHQNIIKFIQYFLYSSCINHCPSPALDRQGVEERG